LAACVYDPVNAMPGKLEPFSVKAIYVRVLREIWNVLREAGRTAWSWKWYYLCAIVVTAPALWYLMRFDQTVLSSIQLQNSEFANNAAGKISRIGKTDGATLCLCVLLLVIGGLFRKTSAARVAICLMLAVIVSGIGVNVLRPAFGRARPYSADAGTFHGPSIGHEYNSFPSGHSSEAWTLATVVSFAYPPAAVPACAYAGSMMWARMQRNQHFPMDVAGGALWGIACALPFAVAARRRQKPEIGEGKTK
jgi:membrane-associated phospholipid phosphatase